METRSKTKTKSKKTEDTDENNNNNNENDNGDIEMEDNDKQQVRCNSVICSIFCLYFVCTGYAMFSSLLCLIRVVRNVTYCNQFTNAYICTVCRCNMYI